VFTLTDGALRMLVLLHFHDLGYSPVAIAFLFLLYEFMGIVTNLIGGWVGARTRLNRTPGTTIKVGEVVVTVNGDCSPCDEMNLSVGPGARDHLKERAGITGMIEKGGTIRVGDPVVLE